MAKSCPVPVPVPEPDPDPHKEPSATASAADALFTDTFWPVYPRKVGKGAARPAFRAALKKASAEDIMAGLEKYRAAVAGKDQQFIAHPKTWLSGERWTDDYNREEMTPDGVAVSDLAAYDNA